MTTSAPHVGLNPTVDGNSARNWCESENLHTERHCVGTELSVPHIHAHKHTDTPPDCKAYCEMLRLLGNGAPPWECV